MSIEQLGSLGEFIAAIAVLISLAYLAMQIRQNTQQSKQNSFYDVFRAYSEMRRSIYTNDSISEPLVKSFNGMELTEVEKLKVETFIGESLFCTLQMIRTAPGIDGFTAENSDEALKLTAVLLQTAIGREYWQNNKKLFPLEFRQQLESHLPGAPT